MKVIESYIRIFVNLDQLDATITFYEQLLGKQCNLRFNTAGLHLAIISSPHMSVLVLAGNPEARSSFESTHLTIKVDDVKASQSVFWK